MRHRFGITLLIVPLAMLTAPGLASAQDRGVSPGTSGFSGGTTYLPYGGPVGGGFIPYTPGSGGGLGVMTRPRAASVGISASSGMSAMRPRATASLSPRGRSALSPLTPLGRLSFGTRGMSSGPATSAPSMIRKTRPPVGGYPFLLPTPIGGASASAAAMSM